MRLALFLLPRAEADIDDHCLYLGKRNPETAMAFYDAVFDSFARLCEAPMLGTTRPFSDRNLTDLRMWFVKGFEKYLIFCRAFGNYIEIVRILHSAQDRDVVLLQDD